MIIKTHGSTKTRDLLTRNGSPFPRIPQALKGGAFFGGWRHE